MSESAAAKSIKKKKKTKKNIWYDIFVKGEPNLKKLQNRHRKIPSAPRCELCFAPFAGNGPLPGRERNWRNTNFCNACDTYLQQDPEGGTYVELSMVIADIRGSVSLGASMSGRKYHKHKSGFVTATTLALFRTNGFILGSVGDNLLGVYPPGFCGKDHARRAVKAARQLLNDIPPRAPDGSLIPIGIGVHTGKVFVAMVIGANDSIRHIGADGDPINVAARLSEVAQPGEALISEATYKASKLRLGKLEGQKLELRGRSKPVFARSLRFAP